MGCEEAAVAQDPVEVLGLEEVSELETVLMEGVPVAGKESRMRAGKQSA